MKNHFICNIELDKPNEIFGRDLVKKWYIDIHIYKILNILYNMQQIHWMILRRNMWHAHTYKWLTINFLMKFNRFMRHLVKREFACLRVKDWIFYLLSRIYMHDQETWSLFKAANHVIAVQCTLRDDKQRELVYVIGWFC